MKCEQAVTLLEFDRRFDVFKEDFVFYDYRQPLDPIVQERLKPHSFDLVLVDPPFLSRECFEETSRTVRELLVPGGKVLVCSGAVMKDTVAELFGALPTSFYPRHRGNRLSNEFLCYANYKAFT